MNRRWRTVPIGSVCELFSGQHIPANEYNTKGTGIGYLTGPSDFGPFSPIVSKWTEHPRRTAIPGDILITVKGSGVGSVNVLLNEEVAISRQLVALRAREVDSQYVHEFLRLQSAVLRDRATGAAIPGLSRSDVLSLEIPVPPLTEQKRIVAMLNEAFEGIDAAVAHAERSLANARELFTSCLNQLITTVSVGAPSVRIGAVGEVFDGPHATPATVDSGPIFLGIAALQDGELNLSKTRHVTRADFDMWTRRVTPCPGDIVFSYETRLGQAAIIPSGLECCLGRRMGLVRVVRSAVEPEYFLYHYLSASYQKYLLSKAVRGATVDRIALKAFPSFELQLPPLESQRRVVEQLNAVRAEVRRLEACQEQKLHALAELKQSLLHNAFSGELSSMEAEREMAVA